MKLIGYVRVSTDHQSESGLGLEAQEAAVRSYAAQGGHEIVGLVVEVASGGKTDRPLLAGVLRALKDGEADGLIVSKLDRMTRSLRHFTEIVEVAKKRKWSLIVVEGGFDMTTPTGRAMAGMLAVFAELERDMISTRTSEALQAKKARQGGRLKGNKPSVSAKALEQMDRLRHQGKSFRYIAEWMEFYGEPTSQGGRWRPGTVKHILDHAA